mgnify:CR=1 FL=1
MLIWILIFEEIYKFKRLLSKSLLKHLKNSKKYSKIGMSKMTYLFLSFKLAPKL